LEKDVAKDSLVFSNLKWGIKIQGHSLPVINARSETLVEKPLFKSLVSKNRGIWICDGYLLFLLKIIDIMNGKKYQQENSHIISTQSTNMIRPLLLVFIMKF
jgi:hypothetical protein